MAASPLGQKVWFGNTLNQSCQLYVTAMFTTCNRPKVPELVLLMEFIIAMNLIHFIIVSSLTIQINPIIPWVISQIIINCAPIAIMPWIRNLIQVISYSTCCPCPATKDSPPDIPYPCNCHHHCHQEQRVLTEQHCPHVPTCLYT